jgi:hypothetical protein
MLRIHDWLLNRFSSDRIRGLYFDLAVFLGNVFLLPTMLRLIQTKQAEGATNVRGGVLFLAAIAAQATGGYLKRPALQDRLSKRADFRGKPWTQFFGGAAPVFLILHYLVFCSALAFGISCFLPYGVDVSKYETHPAFIVAIVVFLAVSAVPTLFVARAMIPYPPAEKTSRGTDGLSEHLADALLYFSVEVMVSFWTGLFLESVYNAHQEGGFHPVFAIAMTLLLALPFFMFYVIPRLLFLVEDAKYVGTWVRMFFAMLPVSYHLLKG